MKTNNWLILCLIMIIGFTMNPMVMKASNEHHHEAPTVIKPTLPKTGEKSALQKLIDATEPGGTLLLEGRVYRGSISITKPITIKGVEGTKVHSLANAFTISETENITLQNLGIQSDDVAIIVNESNSLKLKNVSIEDSKSGIQITNSENIELENVDIIGRDGHFSKKAHAIAIYNSTNFSASGNYINQVMDGFYVENVQHVTLKNNEVENSRYAMHMMYSNNIKLFENKVSNNMTGFMVMIAKDVIIDHNIVVKNNSLNSLGVYAYDLENVHFSNNELRENRIAMDIQNAKEMVVEANTFSTNGTVLQVRRSPTLVVQNNEFHGNILSARTDQAGVQLKHNFYDDYDGKDYDGDGIGDTSYRATNSFGQWMVRKPVYQYFIESPSVITLNMMDTEVTGEHALLMVDEEPVIIKKPFNFKLDLNSWQFLVSTVVLVAMLVVRRRLK